MVLDCNPLRSLQLNAARRTIICIRSNSLQTPKLLGSRPVCSIHLTILYHKMCSIAILKAQCELHSACFDPLIERECRVCKSWRLEDSRGGDLGQLALYDLFLGTFRAFYGTFTCKLHAVEFGKKIVGVGTGALTLIWATCTFLTEKANKHHHNHHQCLRNPFL